MNPDSTPRKFAVFDIDGTITRTSLLQLMSRELVARGNLDVSAGHEIDLRLHDYRQKIADKDFGNYMAEAVKMMFDNLKNLTVEEYVTIAEAIANRSLSNSYVYTRELVANLKKHGFFLIAISGSEIRMVQAFGKHFGFDLSLGQVFYKGEDVIDGNIESLQHPKDKILSALIQKYSLTTTNSLAVGDTSSDIAMLDMVEQPIAFNPNRELFQYARNKSWMVVIERKDVVYGLEYKDGQYVLAQVNI